MNGSLNIAPEMGPYSEDGLIRSLMEQMIDRELIGRIVFTIINLRLCLDKTGILKIFLLFSVHFIH